MRSALKPISYNQLCYQLTEYSDFMTWWGWQSAEAIWLLTLRSFDQRLSLWVCNEKTKNKTKCNILETPHTARTVYVYVIGALCILWPYVSSAKSIYRCVLIQCITLEFIKKYIQSEINPRLSLFFLSVHLAETLRPPGLIWPKLVRLSKAQEESGSYPVGTLS